MRLELMIPLLVLAGLGFFVGLWIAISHMLAALGGYRSLLPYRTTDARTGEPLPTPAVLRFGPASYKSGIVTFTASPEGLGIRVHRIFPGHPDLRIPWDRVEPGAPALRGVAVVLDGRVKLVASRSFSDAVADARSRRLPA
jgi:hypothetical protein